MIYRVYFLFSVYLDGIKAKVIKVPLKSNELFFTSITLFKELGSNVVLLILNEAAVSEEKKQFYTQSTRAKSILKVFRTVHQSIKIENFLCQK